MKKIILLSLGVLSVGLFSFTMPKSDGPGVWLMADGTYTIDQGAIATFTPDDQNSVNELICSIYNIDVTQQQQVELAPLATGGDQEPGTCEVEWYYWFWVIFHRMNCWDNVSLVQGTDQYNLLQIINKYAQPAP